jgi:hypothetical protein
MWPSRRKTFRPGCWPIDNGKSDFGHTARPIRAGPEHLYDTDPLRGGADIMGHADAVSHFALVPDRKEIHIKIKTRVLLYPFSIVGIAAAGHDNHTGIYAHFFAVFRHDQPCDPATFQDDLLDRGWSLNRYPFRNRSSIQRFDHIFAGVCDQVIGLRSAWYIGYHISEDNASLLQPWDGFARFLNDCSHETGIGEPMTVLHDVPKSFIPAVGNALPSLHFAFRSKGSPKVDGSASNGWLFLKHRNFSASLRKSYCGWKPARTRTERQRVIFHYASHRIHLSAYPQ